MYEDPQQSRPTWPPFAGARPNPPPPQIGNRRSSSTLRRAPLLLLAAALIAAAALLLPQQAHATSHHDLSGFSATAGSANDATLTWTAPTRQGTTVTHYVIVWAPSSSVNFYGGSFVYPTNGSAWVGGSATSYTVTGLNGGMDYDFQIQAHGDELKHSGGIFYGDKGGHHVVSDVSIAGPPLPFSSMELAADRDLQFPGKAAIKAKWWLPHSTEIGTSVTKAQLAYKKRSSGAWTLYWNISDYGSWFRNYRSTPPLPDPVVYEVANSILFGNFDLGATYDVRIRAGNSDGWSDWTQASVTIPSNLPTSVTVSSSDRLREGSGPATVTFTLDQPAHRELRPVEAYVVLGEDRVNVSIPTFAQDSRTATATITPINDNISNPCGSVAIKYLFPGELRTTVSFTIIDNDSSRNPCTGRIGDGAPSTLRLERVGLVEGGQTPFVDVLAKLNRPAMDMRIVNLAVVSSSTATENTDYVVGSSRIFIHRGDVNGKWTNDRGTHDWTTTIAITEDAGDNETIVLRATSDSLTSNTLTLNIGQLRRQASQGATPRSCTNCGTLDEPGVVTFASASYAALIEDIYEWRNDPRYSSDKPHTDRWDRVLLAFGETVSDSSLTAMGSSEAQGYADRGWSRWVGVAEALQDLESSGQPQAPKVEAPNRAPVTSAVGVVTIVNESGARRFTSTSMFEDPDKDDMTVSGTSSDTSVATVSASADGSILTVSARGRGATTITATADDGNGGTATNSFTVRVKAAPEVVRTLSDISGLTAGTSQLVSLSGVFSDADGDTLSVMAAALDENVAVAEMSSDGASLTVTGVSAGETGIGVFVHDSDGNQTTANFTVSVTASQPVQLVPPEQTQQASEPNRAPTVSSPLDDVSGLVEGATTNVALSGVFSDADGDELTITASSDNEAVATASVSADNSTLTVSGVSSGNATITVTAQDPDGESASVFFGVEVTASNPQPAADVVSRYDTNGDGQIDRAEMAVAINDYIAGKITYAQVVEVNKAHQSS